jgi:hypothetical protein
MMVQTLARWGAKMKWLLATFLALWLAGCSDADNFNREKPVSLVTPTGHILSLTKPVSQRSLALKADTARADANENSNNAYLMECVSDACKSQCSQAIEKQSRPKWCMYFKEPIVDRHAVSATSDQERKSTE